MNICISSNISGCWTSWGSRTWKKKHTCALWLRYNLFVAFFSGGCTLQPHEPKAICLHSVSLVPRPRPAFWRFSVHEKLGGACERGYHSVVLVNHVIMLSWCALIRTVPRWRRTIDNRATNSFSALLSMVVRTIDILRLVLTRVTTAPRRRKTTGCTPKTSEREDLVSSNCLSTRFAWSIKAFTMNVRWNGVTWNGN